jgi:site-specific DNA-methyltransferase (adenine-specific)
VTNVWDRGALRGPERVRVPGGRAAHLNQKPQDLVAMLIAASSEPGDVVWEPFGGLFTACLAARALGRRAVGAEIDPAWFAAGVRRLAGAAAPE